MFASAAALVFAQEAPPDAEPVVDAGVPDGAAIEPALPPGVEGPIEWAPSHGRDCQRYKGRSVCDGPRRVPVPRAEALARIAELHVGTLRVARDATTSAPPAEWIAAARWAPGELRHDLLWPVPEGRLWRGFGMRQRIAKTKGGKIRLLRGRRPHDGVDIGAHAGSIIVSVNDGLVIYSDNGMRGYGNALLIVHGDGTVALYGHCRATYVAAGDLVRRGQTIAEVGDTGLAHGAHLHFEWRVRGAPQDPLPHFVERPEAHAAPEPPPDEE